MIYIIENTSGWEIQKVGVFSLGYRMTNEAIHFWRLSFNLFLSSWGDLLF